MKGVFEMKKLVTLLLALCMMLSCAALAEVDKADYTAFDETVVLTAAKNDGFTFYGEDDKWVGPEDNPWFTYIKDYLNVEFEYLWVTQSDGESFNTKFNLALAGGELPTVAGVNRTLYETLVDAGLVADMGEAIEKYASDDLKSYIYGSVEETYMTRDGVLYGIPNVRPSMDNYDTVVVRKDWMEKVGVEEVPTTIEGMIELGRKFVDAGLGKYVMAVGGTGAGTGWGGLQGFFQGYDVAWASGYWKLDEETGELFYGMTDDAMADALLNLQGLYKEGLIREDYLVASVGESINNGETGIIYSVCYGPVNTVDLFNLDPEADLIAADIPTVTSEKPTYYVNAVPGNFIFVSADATEQEKEAIIKVLNLMQALWSDMESDVDWGYHRNANPIAGNFDQYEGTFQYAMYYDEIEHAYTTGDLDSFKTANGKTYYNRVMNYEAGDTTLAKYYPIYRVPNGTYNIINTAMKEDRVLNSYYTAPETEFMLENRSMLDAVLMDAANEVIMGADISVWNDAVAEWFATGGQQMTDEANEWYAANK